MNTTVAADGSDHVQHGPGIASDFVLQYARGIHFVHVPETATTDLAMRTGAVEIPPADMHVVGRGSAVMDAGDMLVRQVQKETARKTADLNIRSTEVTHATTKSKADLIVTVRRRHGSVESSLMRSALHKIALGAPCARLTVQ